MTHLVIFHRVESDRCQGVEDSRLGVGAVGGSRSVAFVPFRPITLDAGHRSLKFVPSYRLSLSQRFILNLFYQSASLPPSLVRPFVSLFAICFFLIPAADSLSLRLFLSLHGVASYIFFSVETLA